jgi:hypothetical protein
MFRSEDIENRPDESVRIEGTDVEVLAYPKLGFEDAGTALMITVKKGDQVIFECTLPDVLIAHRGWWSGTDPIEMVMGGRR